MADSAHHMAIIKMLRKHLATRHAALIADTCAHFERTAEGLVNASAKEASMIDALLMIVDAAIAESEAHHVAELLAIRLAGKRLN